MCKNNRIYFNKIDWINFTILHWYLYRNRGSAFEASDLGQPMGGFALGKLEDLLEKHELIKSRRMEWKDMETNGMLEKWRTLNKPWCQSISGKQFCSQI